MEKMLSSFKKFIKNTHLSTYRYTNINLNTLDRMVPQVKIYLLINFSIIKKMDSL